MSEREITGQFAMPELPLWRLHPKLAAVPYQSRLPIELTQTMHWLHRRHTSISPSIEAGHRARPRDGESR
jgi:hypothetical protein